MPRPTASIVIAAHQAEETIERSVRSVLAQNGIGAGLEVIVVDDGSTDRTRELVAAMAADEIPGRIVLASEAPNAGPSVARNRGLELARGHWIGFLDADDEFQPDFLERMLAASRCEPAADVVACAHQIVQAGDGNRRVRTQAVGAGDLAGDQAVLAALDFELSHYVWDKLFARKVLGDAPFPVGVHRGEDLPVVLRAGAAARLVRVLDDPLVTYYVDAASLTWGRVAPVEESDRLIQAVHAAVAPLLGSRRVREAARRAEAVIYLNAAHQAIAVHRRARALETCRGYAGLVPWQVAVRLARVSPVSGVGLSMLKLAPGLYRRVYRQYINSAYALHDRESPGGRPCRPPARR